MKKIAQDNNLHLNNLTVQEIQFKEDYFTFWLVQVWKDKLLPSEPLKPWPLLFQHPHSLAHKHFAGLASSARVRPSVTRAKRWCRGRYAHAGTPRDSHSWGRDPPCLPHCLPCRLSGGRWKQWRRGSLEVGGREGRRAGRGLVIGSEGVVSALTRCPILGRRPTGVRRR